MQQLTSITSPEIMHFVKGDVIGWKCKQNVNIPFRIGPVIARGRGFWKRWTSHRKRAIVDWGQGEFLYGRQYAISAVISENTPPFFVRDGISVTSYQVTIGDTTTIYSPVLAVSVKDRDDNRTLRVVMETKSIYFVFNDSSNNILTAKLLKIGHFTLKIKAVDSCGKSAAVPVFVTVVESNPTTTQETFLGKPVIVWKVGLPLSLGLTLICLGSLLVCSCIRWRKETTFQDAFTHEQNVCNY
ncbi:uncharacterized protein LOC125680382 isoform X2 [Ostrea edulis]|nr:uncharacterized protein LOC125680382 isoform X2 [Ostrea edulis]